MTEYLSLAVEVTRKRKMSFVFLSVAKDILNSINCHHISAHFAQNVKSRKDKEQDFVDIILSLSFRPLGEKITFIIDLLI